VNKTYTILLLIALITNQSCKKDNPAKTDSGSPKIYLLSKIIKHYSNSDETESFTYDDKDRMITRVLGNFTYKYFYDNNDRLNKIELDVLPQGLLLTYTYKYDINLITETRTPASGGDPQVYSFDIDNGNVVRIHLYGDTFIQYIFDSKGNIVKYQNVLKNGQIIPESSFTYDNKKSPFSMVKGYNRHFTMNGFDPYYSLVNNMLNYGYYTITYKYNDDGFPISGARTNNGVTDLNLEYKYIVK
jgi:hypothetical protein